MFSQNSIKNIIEQNPLPKKTEETTNYSRQNSMGSNFSNKNLPARKDTKGIIFPYFLS